ncbi:MAG: hypothetical protein AB7D33_07985 [Sphingobium sp.]
MATKHVITCLSAYTSDRVFAGLRVLKGDDAAKARARRARERMKAKEKIHA